MDSDTVGELCHRGSQFAQRLTTGISRLALRYPYAKVDSSKKGAFARGAIQLDLGKDNRGMAQSLRATSGKTLRIVVTGEQLVIASRSLI